MRYFFHLLSETEVIKDITGVEHDSDAKALAEAHAAAREIIADMILANEPLQNSVFQIVDETGREIGSVPLKRLALNLIGTI